MGFYLNQGNVLYSKTKNSRIFVDKTELIKHTNSLIGENGQFICVSRPRRFGKSVTASMLVAYYSKGCDSRELFSDLKIAKDPSFEKHLNKYNVIHLIMTDYANMSTAEMIDRIKEVILYDLSTEGIELNLPPVLDLPFILNAIYERTGAPFIFVIDEWDCLMRKLEDTEAKQREYLDFLRNLLKDREYVALAYMTGILPVKKYGEHSALNMFTEYSMEFAEPFSEFTGFTTEEVNSICLEFGIDREEMKRWYDGYNVDDIEIYNPNSVVQACMRRHFFSYWTRTENYEALKKYIILNMDGLRDKVERLIAVEKATINTARFQNDMKNLHSADDVLTLLIHLGYLTYSNTTKECWIPNTEVAEEFINCISDSDGWSEVMNAINQSEKCLKATLNGDADTVARIIEQTHRENTSLIKYNDENSLSCVITLSYYTARNKYIIVREYPAGDGFADIVFLPRPNENVPAIVVELKRDKDASVAIEQIKNRNYPEALKAFSGEIILVGINYNDDPKNSEYKKHSCRIEKINK